MKPKVSVVLPTYNQSKYLPKCIESVLSQEFENFELIVVNDGSTDATKEVLGGYFHPKLKVIHQENRKLPGALNTGFKAAKGDYLTWVSSDCYCAPQFLKELSEGLDNNPDIGLVYSDYKSIDKDGNVLRSDHPPKKIGLPEILRSCCIGTSFMYRRECMERIGEYNCQFIGSEDWDYWIRMLRYYRSMHIEKSLYYYRWHEETMTSTIEPYMKITRQHEKNLREFSKKEYKRSDFHEIYYLMGYAYRKQDKIKSFYYYSLALKYRPDFKYLKAIVKLVFPYCN